ncbi:MAG TPA: DMT family transporter [Candidatus Saccharimonadales bacterium]|nr:DMT family transporter [Candidatus Saccharimonadales bacterium]
MAVIRAEPVPGPDDIRVAVIAGVFGGIGVTALYRGLAVGRMGIVAPITGVLAAVIPVGAGVILEGLPEPLVIAGIVVALAAVLLVSRVADEGGGRAGLTEALVAGTAIGLFGVSISQLSEGVVFGPLTIIRGVQAVLVVAAILVTRSAWRPGRSFVPAIIAIGVADMAGNSLYVLAVQSGDLAIASVLSALYPVVTVILAAAVLKERVTREHAIGIALAVLAIVLIGAGSADPTAT